jgi:hypothetical protein
MATGSAMPLRTPKWCQRAIIDFNIKAKFKTKLEAKFEAKFKAHAITNTSKAFAQRQQHSCRARLAPPGSPA